MNSYFILMSLIGYLSGSIMYSYIISKGFKKVDIRDIAEDGNPGGANAMKICGPIVGIICIILDIVKATLPVYYSINYAHITNLRLVPVAVAPVLGHAFSPFLKFKGGKAVASACGVFMALYPQSFVIIIFAALLIIFRFILIVKPDSMKINISLVLLNVITIAFTNLFNVKLIVVLVSVIVMYKLYLNPDKGETNIAIFKTGSKV